MIHLFQFKQNFDYYNWQNLQQRKLYEEKLKKLYSKRRKTNYSDKNQNAIEYFSLEYEEFHVTNGSIYTLDVDQNLQLLAFAAKLRGLVFWILLIEKTDKLSVLCLIFSKINRLFSFGFDDFFVIYSFQNKKFVKPEIIKTPNVIHRSAILTNNDDSIISIGDTNVISIYHVSSRQLSSVTLSTYNKLTCITTNSQQQVAILSGVQTLCLLNIQQQRITFREQINSSFYVKMSNNNNFFAESHGNNINIKSSINKKFIRKQSGNQNYCALIMRFTKDDKFLIAGMDCSITIFNVIQGGFNNYDNHENYFFSIEFQDEEEKVFYTGSKDFRIGKWVKKDN